MKKPNLTFNLLTFNHPNEELTLYFTNSEGNHLTRIFHTQVPEEVITHFGQQDNYYTSFDQPTDNLLPVTKNTKPDRQKQPAAEGPSKWENIKNSAFTISLLKKYYNWQIHNWFKEKQILVKPNFIHDNQIWLSLKTKDDQYYLHEKFTIKVQIAKITNQPELVVSADSISKIFRSSVADLMSDISVGSINWVVFNRTLCKLDDLSDEGRQSLDKVYPVWNFKLRDDLNQPTEAPNRENKYLKYLSHINQFFTDYLNTPEFKAIIPIDSPTFISVHDLRLGRVNETSNQLMFGDGSLHNVPYMGMQQGPFKSSIYSKIQFFYIMHEKDKDVALLLNDYFKKGLHSFRGLYNFARVPYLTKSNFSILFKDADNPLPEIEREIYDRSFDSETHYMAIYLSPHSKHTGDKKHKDIYFKVKQMLLKRDITSQTIEAEKVRQAVIQNSRYDYSLNNIAIAILAKLDGIPWKLNTKLKKELVVGIGAFKSNDTKVQYLGSAFSFANDGKFNQFECFLKNQTDELAGSIILQVQEYVAANTHINRLIIHFYKNMSSKELAPIEEGLYNLGLDIPVFILTINKTESHDIVVFDNDWPDLMPLSGTFINLGQNQYLLFNNTRYNTNGKFNAADGYPFPVKISIRCTEPERTDDHKIIHDLIDQVYQFSRMYWKSVRQQNLPVTIKYPELVAEMYPHFSGREIPNFGKNNLWFL